MKRLKAWMMGAGIVGAMSALSLGTGIPVSDVYKNALLQETTVRDLDAAASLYEKVISSPEADSALRTGALLHVGLCYEKLGKLAEAKAAWGKLVRDPAADTALVQEAKVGLQRVEALERVNDIKASTPVVRVVYETPPTRWTLEWLDLSLFHTLDGKARFFGYYDDGVSLNVPQALHYSVKPWLSVGLEGRRLFSSYEDFQAGTAVPSPFGGVSYPEFRTLTRSVAYIAPVVRLEKRARFGITPFIKLGPAAYRIHFSGDLGSATRWTPGLTGQTGFTLGWSRGFTLTLGYNLLGFFYRLPPFSFDGLHQDAYMSNSGTISKGEGWRWIGGPSFSLGFRW